MGYSDLSVVLISSCMCFGVVMIMMGPFLESGGSRLMRSGYSNDYPSI